MVATGDNRSQVLSLDKATCHPRPVPRAGLLEVVAQDVEEEASVDTADLEADEFEPVLEQLLVLPVLLLDQLSALVRDDLALRVRAILADQDEPRKQAQTLPWPCKRLRDGKEGGRPGRSRDLLGQQTGSKHLKSFPLNGAEPTSGATAEPHG